MTRLQLVGEEEAARITPPIGSLGYLYQAIGAVGICESTMSGMTPTKWAEIMHWPGVTKLLQCEIETMRRLSAVYADMRNNGKDRPQPWEPK